MNVCIESSPLEGVERQKVGCVLAVGGRSQLRLVQEKDRTEAPRQDTAQGERIASFGFA